MFLNKLVRMEIFENDLPKVSEMANNLGLNVEISDKKYKVVLDENMDSWASSLVQSNIIDTNAMHLVYFHYDKKKCKAAKLYDDKDDDYKLGLILNYPICCVESYLKWQTSNEEIDPISTIIDSNQFNGSIYNFEAPNPFTRYIGSGLISHFPCSIHCAATKKLSQNSLNILHTNYPIIARRILKLEKSLVIFHKRKGFSLWNGFKLAHTEILTDISKFHAEGEFKLFFNSVEKIEIYKKTLVLKSKNDNLITSLEADECFFGAFNC